MSEKNNRFCKDLLQRFTGSEDQTGSDPEEEVELNLGLSLGGKFGIDKGKLVRSSSIATILPVVKNDDVLTNYKPGQSGSYSGLTRTASLPVETEEEWRKRKELQSLRRLAAKRRRSEKQRGLGSVAGVSRVGSGSWDFGGVEVAAGATSDGSGGSVPGSAGSQGSSVTIFVQGSGAESAASPGSVQSSKESQERTNHDRTYSSRSKPVDPAVRPSRPKTENPASNKGKEIRANTFDMPCVFTQGDGPGGRRIEGILYKYGKGEEVKIMCICHGSFLTPAEFVRHAGGRDVVNPLKHIVVSPNSSSYL